MHCPNCDFNSPADMLFCGRCGTQLGLRCPTCGKTSPTGFHFCGHCGNPLIELRADINGAEAPAQTAEGEIPARETDPRPPLAGRTVNGDRRQATVLIADVKGSTTILEKIGGEAWVEVMKHALQIMGGAVNRFGGKVDQFRGDGLVAFFGAPFAHEDDPERAVLAALVMQIELEALAEKLEKTHDFHLHVRVGIHTGEVITSSITSASEAFEDTTMGAALTFASRLETAAEPGTVLVSESTQRLVSTRFNWKNLGEVKFRGLRNPVPVFRPLEPISDHEQQVRLQTHGLWTRLVGRDTEIKSLEESIREIRRGSGGIVLINGEAGMGKSRLLFEVRQRTEREDGLLAPDSEPITWLQGRCRSYDQTQPYSMWVDMWQRWLGFGPETSSHNALERLKTMSRDFWGEDYEEYYPYIATILALPLEKEYREEIKHMDADGLRRQFFAAVRSWLEIISRRSPVVLVFTEAHWANDSSLDLLRFCLPISRLERCLFIVVFRPEKTGKIWRFKQFVENNYASALKQLKLKPMKEAQSLALIESMIGADTLPKVTRTEVLKHAGGNPFYLTELIHSMIDSGVLSRDPETGDWIPIEEDVDLDLPGSLKSLLLARVDRLSADERSLLQVASVIGTVFWYDILAPVAGTTSDLHFLLTGLQRAQLISERGLRPDLGREYAFNSTLIREVVYENILRSQREELHTQVAVSLEHIIREKELGQFHAFVAFHYRQAGDCARDFNYSLKAANYFTQTRAYHDAIDTFEHVLTLLENEDGGACLLSDQDPKAIRVEILRDLGRVQFGIGKVNSAETNFRAAIQIGREIDLPAKPLTKLFHWLGEVLFWQNVHQEPIHLGEEGLYLLEGQQESTEAALMNQLIAVGSHQMGDHDKFVDFTLRTAGFLQRLPYTEELRPAFDHIISLYAHTWKNVEEARRWLEILREKGEAASDLRALGEYYEYSAVINFQEGSLEKAFEDHEHAIAKFNHIGDAKHASRAWKTLGTSRLQNGEVDKALACFDKALETARVFDNEVDYAQGYWNKGLALFSKGEAEEAMKMIKQARQIVQESEYINEVWSLSGLGRAYLANGNRKKALRAFQEALQGAAPNFIRNTYQANEILSGLELAHSSPEPFQDEVEKFRQDHPEVHRSALQHWYLVPAADLAPISDAHHHEVFEESLQPGWNWEDPFNDCSFRVNQGLEIQAANERNLHHINYSAPRLLRAEPLLGDFSIQTRCQPAEPDRPGIGGLLVWLSPKYWFCLETGARGAGSLTLRGFMNNTDIVFARGQLAGESAHLRLDRRGQRLFAYCSTDEDSWLFAGSCELTSIEPLYVGLHAIGHINRIIYPGSFPYGAAIRFQEFELLN